MSPESSLVRDVKRCKDAVTFVERGFVEVYYSEDIDSLEGDDWECQRLDNFVDQQIDLSITFHDILFCHCCPGAIKKGRVFFAPSKCFSEGDWWDAAEDGVPCHIPRQDARSKNKIPFL